MWRKGLSNRRNYGSGWGNHRIRRFLPLYFPIPI